jgi:hypothetical protein
MAEITSKDWARIWAHALLDRDFEETFRRNPAAAVKWFQHQFPDPPLEFHDRLFALGPIYLDNFLEKRPEDLEKIAQDGTLNGVAQVRPSEFQLDLTKKP